MQPARAAGSIDYDYYKRKMAEMVRSPPKDGSKMMRNAEKLATCEAAYLNVKNELDMRMRALLHEKYDFANAPLLQLLDFQQNFYGNLHGAVSPLAQHTYEGALLDAENRFQARQTSHAESLAAEVLPKAASEYMGGAAHSQHAATPASPGGPPPTPGG